MLNFTKTVSCSVIGTAQQIDTKLMHRFEKPFVKISWTFFSDTRAETGKNFSLGFVSVQNIGSLKPCHVLLKQSSENALFSDKRIAGQRYMTCQSLKNPLGQVNLCFLSKLLC